MVVPVCDRADDQLRERVGVVLLDVEDGEGDAVELGARDEE